MCNDTPFIHLIKTPYGQYIYDVNTNSIFRTKKKVYDFLLKQQENCLNNIDIDDEVKRMIDEMKNEGLLSSKRPKKIIHPQSKFLEYTLNNKLRKLTLQVTQKCNFRCSYCIYSKEYSENQRNHSLKTMPIKMAKKAINFLVKHSKDTQEVNIGFYGGEPLLEFEFIKKCINYANEVFEGKDISFNITTNGSLLTDEIIEYFINNDVQTMISIDGPKELHDEHRRFAVNGCGTFNVIEKKLLGIKSKYPEYFKKIHFNIVIDPRNDYKCINKLFCNYSYFKEVYVRSTVIDDIYSNEKTYYSQEYISNRDYEIFKAFLYYFNILDKEDVSPIAIQELNEIQNLESKLGHSKELNDATAHSGPCVPGALRLFINVDGDFYPCERVSELSDVMKIGHIDTGFDIKKAWDLLNIGTLTEEDCKNCWAIQHCVLCAKHADNLRELSSQLKKTHCKNVRMQRDYLLRDYIALQEIKTKFKDLIC